MIKTTQAPLVRERVAQVTSVEKSKRANATLLDALAQLLKHMGIDTVFGIPGIHNLSLYDAFAQVDMTIYSTAHEQGAAFMCDGYARVSGRPAICLVIDGPGVLNAATGIAQAAGDSVPMLVVTPCLAEDAALTGRLHEIRDQQNIMASLCGTSLQISDLEGLSRARCVIKQVFHSQRPHPIHIQIPMNVHDVRCRQELAKLDSRQIQKDDQFEDLHRAAEVLNLAANPTLVIGGGASRIDRQLLNTLAERLDAPCLNTVNGKGSMDLQHPLFVGGSPSLPTLQTQLVASDGVLALGTCFSETDYSFFPNHPLRPINHLVRIDIDYKNLFSNQVPEVGLLGDCGSMVERLLPLLNRDKRRKGSVRARKLRDSIKCGQFYRADFFDLFKVLTEHADILVGDSFQLAYYAHWMLEPGSPRHYFASTTGLGTLGFAIPAAIGANIASEGSRVIGMIGDGAAKLTITELSTAVAYGIPVTIIVWNNQGYEEIKKASKTYCQSYAKDAHHVLDFKAQALAVGANYANPRNLGELSWVLQSSVEKTTPMIIELDQSDFLTQPLFNWYQNT